jgi:hypothetical protein
MQPTQRNLQALLRARMPHSASTCMHETKGRSRRYRMRMIEASSTANGHTATTWGSRPLGIACRCGHRAVIELASLGITTGDMRPLRDLPFVCSSCGNQQTSIWIFQSNDEATKFWDHGPPPADPAPPPPARPIVVDGPPGDFTARGWLRADAGWVALVDCDRERYRSDPCLIGPVTIGGHAYDCIAVECTRLDNPTIHVGEVIGLAVREPAEVRTDGR